MSMAIDTESAALPPWSVDPADWSSPVPALGNLLVAAALKWPERTAVNDGESSYTFAELERGAKTVAAWLAAHGIGAGDRVVVLAEKRAVMPVLTVAVWKCAAVYVPLDAAQPPARLRTLLNRLAPKAVITLGVQDTGISADCFLNGERLAALLSGPAADHASVAHQSDEAAYIIFASSATGEPQGVEVGAASLLTYFRNHNRVLRFTSESRVLSLSPFHVDVTFADTLLPLSLGGYVFQFRNLPAGAVIRAVLGRERITHLVAVSMLLAMITGDGRQVTRAKFPGLEMVMTGAQVCHPTVVRIWREQMPQTRFLHAYGPPEAAIFSVTKEIKQVDADPASVCPLGRPLPGMTAKIMKDGEELHRPGAEGELWIGGEQVMRGYFDRPEETERLVVDLAGTRFFQTGDICSYAADGDIVFHRHADEQIVWLAGHRTHLSEVCRAAMDCPGVAWAVAGVVRRGGRDLIALVVLYQKLEAVADTEEHLRAVLPDYMRPTVFAWGPAGLARSAVRADGRELVERVRTCVEQSNSNNFVFSADGIVEPFLKR